MTLKLPEMYLKELYDLPVSEINEQDRPELWSHNTKECEETLIGLSDDLAFVVYHPVINSFPAAANVLPIKQSLTAKLTEMLSFTHPISVQSLHFLSPPPSPLPLPTQSVGLPSLRLIGRESLWARPAIQLYIILAKVAVTGKGKQWLLSERGR